MMFEGKLPYKLIRDCKDVNDLYKKVIKNDLFIDGRDMTFPLYEVLTQMMREDKADFIRFIGDYISSGSDRIKHEIMGCLVEHITEFLDEMIKCEDQ